MLQYEWRPGRDVAPYDANLDVPENDENPLVPDPVEQQQISQNPNLFSNISKL